MSQNDVELKKNKCLTLRSCEEVFLGCSESFKNTLKNFGVGGGGGGGIVKSWRERVI